MHACRGVLVWEKEPRGRKMFDMINRAKANSVALETTLLLHGVPAGAGLPLAGELAGIAREHGGDPCLIGVVSGRPVVGLTDDELQALIAAGKVEKANTANLGVLMHRGAHAATTVSTTMEIASAAGVRVFATGGLGGVHRGYGAEWDVSADLAAFTRFPVAVVTSGVKSILDVEATREALETLGVPVVGYQTDRFPAFYLRESGASVDARFDDLDSLAAYIRAELKRTGRGIVVANPIPRADEIARKDWDRWLEEAQGKAEAAGVKGRAVTPFLLGQLHALSGGRTLAANLALVKWNTAVAAGLAARLAA